MRVLEITQLELPPSANHLYQRRRGGGVARSKRYSDWLQGESLQVMVAMTHWKRALADEPVRFPLRATGIRVKIEAYMSRRRDLDNVAKPVLDLLEGCGVWIDDRLVDRLELQRREPPLMDSESRRRHPGWLAVIVWSPDSAKSSAKS